MTVMRPDLILLQRIIDNQSVPDDICGGGPAALLGRHDAVLTTGGPFFFDTPAEGSLTRGIVIVNTSADYTLLVKSRLGAGVYGSAETFFAAANKKWIAIPPLQDSRFLPCRDPGIWYMLGVGGTIAPFFVGS